MTQVIYEYDIDQTAIYGTANNRLMTADTSDLSACDPLISSCPIVSTDFYYYTFAGNVERVVTELASPALGQPKFSAVRYDYAANAQTATYVVGETWDVDADLNGCPDNYTVTFAREYRYDGARARYIDRMLDEQQAQLGNAVEVLSTWTDYDGNNTYSDFTMSGADMIDGDRYELGIAHVKVIPGISSDTFYAHNDHLGTLRTESDEMSAFNTYPVHTAFGEDMTNLGQRHSYVGAFGYQANANFTALHVGARYYDPSSGRFLQRDPIGIRGGLNVYEYVKNKPQSLIDPEGLHRYGRGHLTFLPVGPWCPACAREAGYRVQRIPAEAMRGYRKFIFWLGCAAVAAKNIIIQPFINAPPPPPTRPTPPKPKPPPRPSLLPTWGELANEFVNALTFPL